MNTMSEPKRILLVEDEAFIRELYSLFLKEDNYIVDEAPDGEVAVEAFKTNHYSLVLLDILLPEKDGMVVLDEVKRIDNTVPVVMLTNLAQDDLVKKAFDLGAAGYLLKARISKKELLAEVKGFVEPSMIPSSQPQP